MSETVQTQFYTITEEAWKIMLQDILSAEKSIDIEQYIFIHDEIGDEFIDALTQKSRQGLKVRLLLDMVGSFSTYNSTLPDELRGAGIQVRFFNPIKPWRIANLTSNFFRDHRKIMVIDNTIAHLGGVGIQATMAKWRDTHLRITGPIVSDIAKSFETIWKGLRRWNFIQFKRPQKFIKKFNLLTNAPILRQRYMYQALVAHIRFAQKYIYLTSPYFIPDTRLFRILRLAARKGIDVRLLVPEVADHLFVDHARESYFSSALKAGIKIYLYKNVMMHAKTAVIDDTWATAGSFNLDSLSFWYNHEANISSDDDHFIQSLKQHFLNDIRNSREIIYEEWIKRPFIKKFLEYVTWPLHGIM